MPSPYGPKNLIVPNDTDPPDAPADFRRLVDSMPKRVAVMWNDVNGYGEIGVAPGSFNSIIGANVESQPGALIMASGSTDVITWNTNIVAAVHLRIGGVTVDHHRMDGNPNGLRMTLAGSWIAASALTYVELVADFHVGGRLGFQWRHVAASAFIT